VERRLRLARHPPQPRDRLFADVVAEWGDDVQAVYDPDKRARVRERQRRRRIRRAAWETGTFPSPDYATARAPTPRR
jgi:hypothetical protein